MTNPILHVITGTGIAFLGATIFGVKFGKEKLSKEHTDANAHEHAGPSAPVVAFRFDHGFERSASSPAARPASSSASPIKAAVNAPVPPAQPFAHVTPEVTATGLNEAPNEQTNFNNTAPTITPWWEDAAAVLEPATQSPETFPDPLDVVESAGIRDSVSAAEISPEVLGESETVPSSAYAQDAASAPPIEPHEWSAPLDVVAPQPEPFPESPLPIAHVDLEPISVPESQNASAVAVSVEIETPAPHPLNESEEEERAFDEDQYVPDADDHIATILRQPVSMHEPEDVVPQSDTLDQIRVPDVIESEDEVSYFGEKPLTPQEKAAALERWNARLAAAQKEEAEPAATAWQTTEPLAQSTPWEAASEARPSPPPSAPAPFIVENASLDSTSDAEFEYTEDLLEHLAQTGGFEAIPTLVECLTACRPMDDLWWAVAGLERLHAIDKLEPALSLHPVIAARAALAIVGDATRSQYEAFLSGRVDQQQAQRILDLLTPAIGYAA